MIDRTIAAVATASGAAGVAVVRLSGDTPLQIASKMFIPTGKTPVVEFVPYRMYPGEIDCGTFRDFGMCVYFRAPHSFTGEDVVEFHSHGGVAIARGVFSRAVSLGARPATKGEFTRRAFLNGKLSLSSAEGLIDMIESESESAVRAGYSLYREKLTKCVIDMQNEIKIALAGIEANIDFPEEGIEETETQTVTECVQKTLVEVNRLLQTYRAGSRIKNGVKVALVGSPNTGKSSLFNAFVGYDRAIVTDIPGTTRDVVDGAVEWEGVRFVFSDTAGIRNATDEVERIGILRSEKEALGADIVLRLYDSTVGGETMTTDEREIIVYNKCDLAPAPSGVISVSARTGEGIEVLKQAILQRAETGKIDENAGYLTEERHYYALQRAKEELSEVLDKIGIVPLDLLAVNLLSAWQTLGEITGETAPEAVVNEIFSRFCVGK